MKSKLLVLLALSLLFSCSTYNRISFQKEGKVSNIENSSSDLTETTPSKSDSLIQSSPNDFKSPTNDDTGFVSIAKNADFQTSERINSREPSRSFGQSLSKINSTNLVKKVNNYRSSEIEKSVNDKNLKVFNILHWILFGLVLVLAASIFLAIRFWNPGFLVMGLLAFIFGFVLSIIQKRLYRKISTEPDPNNSNINKQRFANFIFLLYLIALIIFGILVIRVLIDVGIIPFN